MRLFKITPRTDYGPDESRRGPLRRLTLRTADGTPFLERWALDLGVCGVYVHHLVGPDPGLDLHDHPWPFAAVVLSGAYVDEAAEARTASNRAAYSDDGHPRGDRRLWRRGSVHVVGLDEAHRITSCTPGCWTLVLRGRARRPWGFYTPDGWVDSDAYDYEGRRPGSVQRAGVTSRTRRLDPVGHEWNAAT